MENKITHEFIEKVRQAKNAEEFIAIVKENGIEIPEDKANALFEKLKSVLSDEELGGVSGGYDPSRIYSDVYNDPSELEKIRSELTVCDNLDDHIRERKLEEERMLREWKLEEERRSDRKWQVDLP